MLEVAHVQCSWENLKYIKNQCCRSLISFSYKVITSVHLQQGLPHCSLISSIALIGGIPLNTIFVLRFRNLCCSQVLPPTNHRKHNCDGTLADNVLQIQENIVVPAYCGHLPHCSTSSKISTTSPLVCCVKASGTLDGKPTHPTSVFDPPLSS